MKQIKSETKSRAGQNPESIARHSLEQDIVPKNVARHCLEQDTVPKNIARHCLEQDIVPKSISVQRN